jgi:hypothetical protein
MTKTLLVSFAIITLIGFLANSAYASYEHNHEEEEYGGDYYYNNNPCKGGLKVFASLTGSGGIFADSIKVTFSYGGYSKSKIVESTTPEVGYKFYEGTVPEYGNFRVTLENLDSGKTSSVLGVNHAGCHPEYVSLRVPQ